MSKRDSRKPRRIVVAAESMQFQVQNEIFRVEKPAHLDVIAVDREAYSDSISIKVRHVSYALANIARRELMHACNRDEHLQVTMDSLAASMATHLRGEVDSIERWQRRWRHPATVPGAVVELNPTKLKFQFGDLIVTPRGPLRQGFITCDATKHPSKSTFEMELDARVLKRILEQEIERWALYSTPDRNHEVHRMLVEVTKHVRELKR